MPFLLCSKESYPVVINNFFFFLFKDLFKCQGQSNTTRQVSGWEKKTAQGREEKQTYHAYSCGWKVQWLLSLRIVSSGKTVCAVGDSWKKKKSFNSFLSPTMSKCQCRRSTMAKALCAHKWLPKPQLQLFFLFFSSSANSGRKFFSVKWCSAEWQTNRAISPLARAHFSILDIAFSLQLA